MRTPPQLLKQIRTPDERRRGWQEGRAKTNELLKLHAATIHRVVQEMLQHDVLYMNELVLLVQRPDLFLAAWFKKSSLRP